MRLARSSALASSSEHLASRPLVLYRLLLAAHPTPWVSCALLAPFAIGAGLAYVGARWPRLALLPVFSGLVAFLSAYGGPAAATDVYGPYSTVCYMAVGLGTGWVASRLLWPATAAGLFRQRVAAQLALCADAVRGAREAGDAERRRRLAPLLRGFAAQAVQLGPLHQQALQEPVERALDPSRREEILALVTDLGA